MEYIFDIFLILILLLVIALSTKRGFVRSVWSSVTMIGAFVIAYIFGPVLGEWICYSYVLPYITEHTFEVLTGLVSVGEGSYDISELFTNLPAEFIELAANCGADIAELQERFVSAITVPTEQLHDLASSISLPVSLTLSNAIGIIAVFFAAALALALIGLVVKIITKLPVLKTLDGILGFLFGIIKGIVVVCIMCVVVAIFVESEFLNGNVGVYFKMLTEDSYIFRIVCEFLPVDFINIS